MQTISTTAKPKLGHTKPSTGPPDSCSRCKNS